MDIITILCAIVIGQAVVLAGIFSVVVRLRSRIERVGEVSASAIAQMSQLVHEAHALSQIMTRQIEEQIRLREMESPAPAVATPPVTEPLEDAEERVARRPVRRSTAQPSGGARADGSSASPRTHARSSADDVWEAPQPDDSSVDGDVARQNGMDPLGVALQRSLARQRSRLVKAS
jgi:hypothetical protein